MKILEMSQTDRNIMNNINKLMDQKSVKGIDLANAIGTTPGSISRFKKGVSTPTCEQLIKIADYFGVTLAELFGAPDKSIILDDDESKIIRALRENPNYKEVINKILDIK